MSSPSSPSSPSDTAHPQSSSSRALLAMLQGEIAAEGTYREAIAMLDAKRAEKIRDNWRSHARRIALLTDQLTQRGVKPASSPGMWASFERLVERGADMFSDDDIILALESGEDHCLKNYQTALAQCDAESLAFVREELLAEQEETHRVMHDLKHASPIPGQHPQKQ